MKKITKNQPLSFKPVFTKKKSEEIESAYYTNWTFHRKVMMRVLSRSSEQLMEDFKDVEKEEEAGEAFLEILKVIESYQTRLKAGVELSESALARLLAVGEQIVEISKQPVEA